MKLLKTLVVEVGDTGPAQSHYTLSFDIPNTNPNGMCGNQTVSVNMDEHELMELRDLILIVEPLGGTANAAPAIASNYEQPRPLPTSVPPGGVTLKNAKLRYGDWNDL